MLTAKDTLSLFVLYLVSRSKIIEIEILESDLCLGSDALNLIISRLADANLLSIEKGQLAITPDGMSASLLFSPEDVATGTAGSNQELRRMQENAQNVVSSGLARNPIVVQRSLDNVKSHSMGKTLRKGNIADRVATRLKGTRTDGNQVLNAVLEGIIEALKEGSTVTLTGFGTFEVRAIKERKIRTIGGPKAGQLVSTPARMRPAFRPGTELTRAVGGE